MLFDLLDPLPKTATVEPSELALRLADGAPQYALPYGSTLLGSDPRCGLQLSAPGVRPFHCLILRGKERTLVRRLAGSGRLNARRFSEAALTAGDRLAVGELELEAVDLAAGGGRFLPGEAAGEVQGPADPVARLEEIQARLMDLEREQDSTQRTLARRALAQKQQRDGAREQRTADRRLRRRERQAQRLLATIERRWASIAARLSRREKRLAALATRLEQGGRTTAIPNDVGATTVEAGQWQQALAAERQVIDAQRQAWETRHADDLAALRSAIDELRTAASHPQPAADEVAAIRWEGLSQRLAQLEAQIAARDTAPDGRPDLTPRLDALEARVGEWTAQWEAAAARESIHGADHDRLEDLNARTSQLERRIELLALHQHVLEATHHEADGRGEHRGSVDQRLAGLRAEREALEEEQRQERAERALARLVEHCRPADESAPAQDESQAPLARQAKATTCEECLEPPHSDEPAEAAVDVPEGRWEAAAEEPLARVPEVAAPIEDAPANAKPVAEEVQYTQPTRQAPESTDALFARLGLSMPAADETTASPIEPQRRSETPRSPSLVLGDVVISPTQESRGPAPAAHGGERQPAAKESSDEESIEQYMARLMDRVRSVSPGGEPARPAAPVRPVEPPQTVGESVAEEEPAPVVPERRPVERVRPPELFTDLNALRELANLNARTAIDVHARQRITRSMYGKLMLTVVALTVSLALVMQSTSNRILLYSGLGISLTVAAVWGVQYLLLVRRLTRKNGEAGGEAQAVEGETPVTDKLAATGPALYGPADEQELLS